MRIAITGGSGSLGRTLIERLAVGGADRIVTFSRDEQKRGALHNEFKWHPGFRVMAGDVRDPHRLAELFRTCEVVVHAAARKVVTAHPDEAEEMLKTNVLGTQNVIDAATQAGVGKLLFISSDKAVRAENVYGVSKAMAEHLAINANARTFPRGLRVSVLRYGNVLASNGSVVRVWRSQIEKREPLEVSDRRMTRFWLTLPQAVDLVLQAIATLRGGEIFIPDIPAAPVLTLAEALCASAGIETTYAAQDTGIRPGGEKLHEELMSAAEIRRALRKNNMYVVPPYQGPEMWDAQPWLGQKVEPDMVYRSDVWHRQLDVTGMQKLLEEADAVRN